MCVCMYVTYHSPHYCMKIMVTLAYVINSDLYSIHIVIQTYFITDEFY